MPSREPTPQTADEPRADARLVEAACADEPQAFAQLVERYETRLRRFLHPYAAGDGHDVDDLVQEAFLRAWQGLERYDPRWAFSTWLFTIASRLAIDNRRRKRPVSWPRDWIDGRMPPVTDGPARQAEESEQRRNLWRHAAEQLSREQFMAIWLYYAEDMPVKEVARVLGRTSAGVKVQLHRARQRLRERLPKQWQPNEEPGNQRQLAGDQAGKTES